MTIMANSYYIRISGRHLGFPLKEASAEVVIGTVVAPENMGVAAGILFLSSVELEKPLGPPVVTNVCKKMGGYTKVKSRIW